MTEVVEPGSDGSAPAGSTPDGPAPGRVAPDGTTPDGTTPDGSTPDGVAPEGKPIPPEIAARLVRALDRAPSMFVTLIGSDMRSAWLSTSATWITGTDPVSRPGRNALERVHPDDRERLIHGLAQLKAATPSSGSSAPTVPEPLRYRLKRPDDTWITVESVTQNLLHDPDVDGLLVLGRRVGGPLDGVGHVLDLLVDGVELPEVLAACAMLVPAYLGDAAVVGLVPPDEVGGATGVDDDRGRDAGDDDGEPTVAEIAVVGVPDGSVAAELARDERWWRDVVADGRARLSPDFAGVPDDLAAAARAAGYRSSWVLPLTEPSTGVALGAVVTWVRLSVEPNIGTESGVRQATRLATLVVGERRRHQALRREAMTDPLTGLGNRTALRQRLAESSGPVTLALVDLDAFKPVNDVHGHQAGDEVLRTIGRRLRGAVREADCVVRFGGDEFAVVFADGTSEEGVRASTVRIVEAVERPIVTSSGAAISVGASLGLATASAADVVPLADKSLYAAKASHHADAVDDRDDP